MKSSPKMKYYLIHATVLLMLNTWFLNTPWSMSAESGIMRFINKVETLVLPEDVPEYKEVVFVNTYYANQIVEVETHYGTPGNISICNRAVLAQLFKTLDSLGNKQKFVLCDILLDVKTSHDASLQAGLDRVERYVFPNKIANPNKTIFKETDISFNQAPSGYITYNGAVSKMELFNKEESAKSLPLTMYEVIHNDDMNFASALSFRDGYVIPKYFFPRYYYQDQEISNFEIPITSFIELIKYGTEEMVDDLLKDKVVVVGNFEDDVHFTSVGYLSGPAILYNTYLSIIRKYHLIHWSWFLFAFGCFVGCLWLGLRDMDSTKHIGKTGQFFSSLLILTLLIFLLSFFSSVLFQVHVTVIPVILYIQILKLIKTYTS
jgi:hypothetical protein